MNFNEHITNNIIWSYVDSRKEIFTGIYEKNLWESKESISGEGSEISQAQNIIKALPELFRKYGIKTFIDAPCGDYNWMKQTNIDYERYLGVDIVEDLIKTNNEYYSGEKTKFVCGDIIDFDFPDYDLILCRDCFIHLSNIEITAALNNFRRCKIKYLLTTDFPDVSENQDIITGQFRKINLSKAPFGFEEPLTSIHEKNDKYLTLWNLAEAVL